MLVKIREEILRLHSLGLLKQLLTDKTTKENVIWATDAYADLGIDYQRDKEINIPLITGVNSDVITTRATKALEKQSERTRRHAEVFTPSWICQKMVSYADSVWFEGSDAFLNGKRPSKQVCFPKEKKWQHYVDSRRLEITCGEAPYLINRYDVSTGEYISLKNRQGVLDRKLRIVNENAMNESEWLKWSLRAFQSTYGYEFQGDNLLIARVNLLITFEEYLFSRWKRKPTSAEYREIIKTIVWNIWQMDGLSGTIPYCKADEEYHQFNLFECFDIMAYQEKLKQPHCRIYDWRRKSSLEYINVNKGEKTMKFDFVIGNPPYQDETIGDNKGFAPPIYNKFLDAAYQVSDKVEMIHPARFLFNAGSTPKAWNEKMLNDKHFKVLYYETDASKIFPNTDIKGGIVISYRDLKCEFEAIKVFTKYPELNNILHKIVEHKDFITLSSIVITRTAYKLTDIMHKDHPEAMGLLSKGHAHDMSTNIFDRLPQIFYEEKPKDEHEYIQILGRENNERLYKYIRRDYVNQVKNLDKYKIFIPKANGVGDFGEIISLPIIAHPGTGSTETFLSIGLSDTECEIESTLKYIKTKFTRALLGILKTTQDITPDKWKYVPLQDFTNSSDIDWSKSITEIDRQLYVKYGLTDKEIEFIETHVKEMT